MPFFHDSQDLKYRMPFGAVPCGTEIQLSLICDDPDPDTEACLRLWEDQGPVSRIEGSSIRGEGKMEWHFTITAPSEPALLWYAFEVIQGENRSTVHAPADGLGGKSVSEGPFCPWQITVFSGNHLPDWTRDAIMYQIFPDRFRIGGGGIHTNEAPETALIHAHWDDLPYYIRNEEKEVIRWDFFGGNLEGIEEKLDMLQSLGVNLIYLNPIFLSFSNHKYDTADYRLIDPMLGGIGAFRSLIKAVKARGMHLILDGVFSHTGSDSVYFNRYGSFPGKGAYQGKDSPFYEWYLFKKWPDQYKCWWDVESMPDVNELCPSYLSYQVTGHDSTVRQWMAEGIDGFRLDVADELPDAFLRSLKQVLREENQDSFLLGEVWEDASNKISYDVRRRYFAGDELDSVTNYPFHDTMVDLILGRCTACQAVPRMKSLRENYPDGPFFALMNMTGTHDTVRILTLLGAAPDSSTMTEPDRAIFRLSAQDRRAAVQRLELYLSVLFTHPGIPSVYYGDEAGLEGFEDPYNRKTYPWGKVDPLVFSLFRRYASLRKREILLRRGDYQVFSSGRIYGHSRSLSDECMITLILPEGEEETIVWRPAGRKILTASFAEGTGADSFEITDNALRINMEGNTCLVLRVEYEKEAGSDADGRKEE